MSYDKRIQEFFEKNKGQSNKMTKDGENTFKIYGVAAGCKQMGVGEIVKATHLDLEVINDVFYLDGIEVLTVFTIDNNELIYF